MPASRRRRAQRLCCNAKELGARVASKTKLVIL